MSYLEQRTTLQSKVNELEFAIKQSPNDATLCNELAILLERSGELDKALHFYKETIKRDVSFVNAYNNIGVILYKQGRYPQAIAMFEMSLGVDDKFVSTYVNLGAACNKAKAYEKGEKSLLKAIELDSKNSGAYANLGNIYNKMKRHTEARVQHEMAISLDNKSASNHANIGITYKNLELYDEALESLKMAIMIDKYFVNAHFDLATTYLKVGRYKKGFTSYEWRFKKPQMRSLLLEKREILNKPQFSLDLDMEDKKLLLYTEQGYGDILQFARFVKVLKSRYPKLNIMIQVREGLESLFRDQAYFDEVISRDDNVGEFDYQCALMSLARILGIEKDHLENAPYIKNKKGKISLRLSKKKFNIGVVWGASGSGESYEDKVFSLKYFEPLMDDSDIKLYSLQVAGDVKQIKALGYEKKIVDLESKLVDFHKTAVVIDKLDFVITTDTSVAHLAGAMGKEAMVVLQKNADWRWGIDEKKSVWYPSLTLVHQDKQGDWDSAFKKVYKMIKERKN